MTIKFLIKFFYLSLADISSDISNIFKNGQRSEKGCFKFISMLPDVSKLFERLFFDQISDV